MMQELTELMQLNFTRASMVHNPRECNQVAHALTILGKEWGGNKSNSRWHPYLSHEHCGPWYQHISNEVHDFKKNVTLDFKLYHRKYVILISQYNSICLSHSLLSSYLCALYIFPSLLNPHARKTTYFLGQRECFLCFWLLSTYLKLQVSFGPHDCRNIGIWKTWDWSWVPMAISRE
jgi:hypothetical protein